MTAIVFILAIGAGLGGTLMTRASAGFSRWRPAAGATFSFTIATVALGWLLERWPVGIVYAVWTGCAAIVLMVVDSMVFDVRVTRLQAAGMITTITGVIVLGSALR